MRPLPGSDGALPGRSRSTSFTDNVTTPVPGPHQAPQMSFFIADEKTMEASLERSSASHTRSSRESMKRSDFGVESLDTSMGSSSMQDNDDISGRVGKARNNWKLGLIKGLAGKSEEDIDSQFSSPRSSPYPSRDLSPSEPRRSPKTTATQPFTPLHLQSPMLGSIASGRSSRRNSETDFFTDDAASQAILSSGEEERDMSSEVMESSNASQLVMPSIKMPSRRPFTEKGKNMGRLKVLIAGDSGKLLVTDGLSSQHADKT